MYISVSEQFCVVSTFFLVVAQPDVPVIVAQDELKDLIRKGIPDTYRSKVWKWCIHMHLDKRYVSVHCSI